MKFYLIKQVENYIREIYPQEKQENVKKRYASEKKPFWLILERSKRI